MTINDIVIVIPSLNPDEKFIRIVDGMRSVGFSRFVFVDDGSDDDHKQPFEISARYPQTHLIVHPVNLGKGQALKDAFEFVYNKLPEVDAVITIDGDGQHTPQDALKLANRLIEEPNKIVFGCRDFDQKNVPLHNKLGNKLTSKVFRLLFGMKLSDTQTGLRGFPRKYLLPLVNEVEGTRFEYESNMLLFMNDTGIPFSEVPIQTLYLEENKSSHFNPIKDSIRIYKPIIKKSKSLKYIISSLCSTLFELILFTILNVVFKNVSSLGLQTFLTTGLSRICSAIMNFSINKTIVFHNNASVKKTGVRYVIMAICQYAASYLLCLLFFSLLSKVGITGFVRTPVKMCVDLLLFFISYFLQKNWVFKIDSF